MDMKWSLDELYTSFDSKEYREDFEKLECLIEEIIKNYDDLEDVEAKAKHLGYDKGLPFYELFAPIGEMSSEFSYDKASKYIVDNFRSFSDELADFADKAFKKRWIDVEPRPGKRGGAFCSNLHPIGESRILANFDGSFSNTITLAHELGHGYHGHVLRDEDILNTSYPMPIAETASIFCETIVTNAALENASREEQLGILESSISDATQVIVDIYKVCKKSTPSVL